MTDSMIRRYPIVGEIEDDSRFPSVQETYRIVIEGQMRDEGFVPLYDIDPVFRTWYIPERNVYGFRYTMQGVYVGKDKSWDIKGVVNNREVGRISTPTNQNKSEAS